MHPEPPVCLPAADPGERGLVHVSVPLAALAARWPVLSSAVREQARSALASASSLARGDGPGLLRSQPGRLTD